MARVVLDIADSTTRITLASILQAEGHGIVSDSGDVVITDDSRRAVIHARKMPTLIASTAGGVADAVRAMRKGAYGYILLPLQPGEAPLMVERALGVPLQPTVVTAEPSTLGDAEAELILRTLRQCKYNKTKAASLLGIGRNTLWRKLKKLRQVPPLQ